MHDLDRTQQFVEAFATDFEGESDFELDQEFDQGSDREANWETGMESGSPLSEEAEIELAAELLGVTNEQELDQFIGGLFKKIKKGVSAFARSSLGKQLGAAVKGIAKQALPTLGTALGGVLGTAIPIPGVGTMVGAAVGKAAAGAAGQALGLEIEGLSDEDQDLEVARRVVRLAADAAERLDDETEAEAGGTEAVREALVAAARVHAPGLLAPTEAGFSRGRGYSGQYGGSSYGSTSGGSSYDSTGGGNQGRTGGRWIRRGNAILVLGA